MLTPVTPGTEHIYSLHFMTGIRSIALLHCKWNVGLRSTKSYKTSARASTIKNLIKLIRLVLDSTGVKLGERKDKLLYSFISPRYSPNDQLLGDLVKILGLGAFEYLHLLAQGPFKLSFSVHQAIFSFFFLLIPLKFIFHFR